MTSSGAGAVLEIEHGALAVGGRTLWSGLDLRLEPGELVAVLGPNGSGKSSLFRAVLGQLRLSEGGIRLLGAPPRRGDRRIGYIPQQRILPPGTPLRGRDLVALGANGHRFGLPLSTSAERRRIEELLDSVGARRYARRPVGLLSGGEQQRLRAAQALAGDPRLLLADEPLLSLDVRHQGVVAGLIDRQRRERGAAVIVVTHDLGPFAGMVDRVVSFGEEAHLHPHHDLEVHPHHDPPDPAEPGA